jgi:hypothetical protein
MDMPEGWTKLRGMRFENADEVDILDCLDLMKDMAETLELFDNELHNSKKAHEILEKFKEWR